jgi:hypothetical protein
MPGTFEQYQYHAVKPAHSLPTYADIFLEVDRESLKKLPGFIQVTQKRSNGTIC